MHLIPQSWSHLHILVGVFPSFGLVIVLGFYIGGLLTDNNGIKRTCLALFGLVALLSVPTYFSGAGSMAVLSRNPSISKDMMSIHYGWGMAALLALVVTGIVAWVELWRAGRDGRASNVARYLVPGLAVVAVALMVVADGWEINHRELRSTVSIPDVSTSPVWPHVHMILNHVPTVGFVFALAFYIVALVTKNDGMTRGSLILFVICGIAGVPTYVTGTASMWALTQPPIPEISKAVINAHPRVRMSRVMARRSPIMGAVVSAEIVLADLVGAPDTPATEDVLKLQITEHCQRSLASHKVPAIIRFVASLEVSAAGKLVRPNA